MFCFSVLFSGSSFLLETHGGVIAGLVDRVRCSRSCRNLDEDVGQHSPLAPLRTQDSHHQRDRSHTALLQVRVFPIQFYSMKQTPVTNIQIIRLSPIEFPLFNSYLPIHPYLRLSYFHFVCFLFVQSDLSTSVEY